MKQIPLHRSPTLLWIPVILKCSALVQFCRGHMAFTRTGNQDGEKAQWVKYEEPEESPIYFNSSLGYSQCLSLS